MEVTPELQLSECKAASVSAPEVCLLLVSSWLQGFRALVCGKAGWSIDLREFESI